MPRGLQSNREAAAEDSGRESPGSLTWRALLLPEPLQPLLQSLSRSTQHPAQEVLSGLGLRKGLIVGRRRRGRCAAAMQEISRECLTIAAVATAVAPGQGGIAVVRLAGSQAQVAVRAVTCIPGDQPWGHRVLYGHARPGRR